jgi:hypothetical protein
MAQRLSFHCRIVGIRRRCRALGFAAASLAVAASGIGCTPAIPWVRPGTDHDRAAADLAACQELTREETQRDYAIDTDIVASRGKDWSNSGVKQMQTQQVTADQADKSDRILSGCMSDKGYSPAP